MDQRKGDQILEVIRNTINIRDGFLPLDAMLWRYLLSLCVCPSVCMSQIDVLQRWLNIGSSKQRHTIAQELYSFLTPKISAKFRHDHPQRGRQIEVG